MKSILNYIVEAEDSANVTSTKNNKERKEQLEKLLKGKGYSEYIETLNKMIDNSNGNLKALLVDGFGGELADTEFKFFESVYPVTRLKPTQSEIDVYNSISFPLIFPDSLKNIFDNAKSGIVINNIPIITFRSEYIIDGHHRWSSIFAFEPSAKVKTYNYDNEELSSTQMLKAVQGTIAAVKVENDGKGLPQEVVNGQNLFDSKWNKDAIVKYVSDVLTGKIEVPMKKNGEKIKMSVKDNGKAFLEVLTQYHKDLDSVEKAAKYIADNLMKLKSNNEPVNGAPNRGEMPQTDAAGANPKDPKSATPDKPDSALGKLKDKGIVGDAVK